LSYATTLINLLTYVLLMSARRAINRSRRTPLGDRLVRASDRSPQVESTATDAQLNEKSHLKRWKSLSHGIAAIRQVISLPISNSNDSILHRFRYITTLRDCLWPWEVLHSRKYSGNYKPLDFPDSYV